MAYNQKQNFFIGSDGNAHIRFFQTQEYQPLTTIFVSIFVNEIKPQAFYFLHSFILFLLIPFLFYTITKHALSIPIYFSSYFVWISDNLGTLPQTLIVVLLLVLMLRKNNLERVLIIILSLGIHNIGFILLLAWFFIDNFFESKFFCVLPTTFSLSNTFSITNQNIFKKTLIQGKFELNLVNSYITWSHVLNLFSRIFLLPLWFFSIKTLIKIEYRKYLFLLIFILLAGFFSDQVNPLRILSLSIFPLGIGLVENYKTMTKKSKLATKIFLAIGILFNFYSWIILKNYNYCLIP